MSARLEPTVYWIGSYAIEHGERGDEVDAEHPSACLCGEPDYLACPGAFGDGSLLGAVVIQHDGRVDLLPNPETRDE